MVTDMIETVINGRWNLLLPEHRAKRPEWATGWEPERLDAMYREISESKKRPYKVIDVGAEEGDMSAILSMDHVDMLLIEPNEKAWPNIRAIFEANGRKVPRTFYGFAAATGTLSPSISNDWPSCSTGAIDPEHGFSHLAENSPTIPRIRIDELNFEPDMITIDVEGSEWEVLKGAEQTLRTKKPVLFMSVHPEFMFNNHSQYEGDMHAWLRSIGYTGKHLAYDHEHHWEYRA